MTNQLSRALKTFNLSKKIPWIFYLLICAPSFLKLPLPGYIDSSTVLIGFALPLIARSSFRVKTTKNLKLLAATVLFVGLLTVPIDLTRHIYGIIDMSLCLLAAFISLSIIESKSVVNYIYAYSKFASTAILICVIFSIYFLSSDLSLDARIITGPLAFISPHRNFCIYYSLLIVTPGLFIRPIHVDNFIALIALFAVTSLSVVYGSTSGTICCSLALLYGIYSIILKPAFTSIIKFARTFHTTKKQLIGFMLAVFLATFLSTQLNHFCSSGLSLCSPRMLDTVEASTNRIFGRIGLILTSSSLKLDSNLDDNRFALASEFISNQSFKSIMIGNGFDNSRYLSGDPSFHLHNTFLDFWGSIGLPLAVLIYFYIPLKLGMNYTPAFCFRNVYRSTSGYFLLYIIIVLTFSTMNNLSHDPTFFAALGFASSKESLKYKIEP